MTIADQSAARIVRAEAAAIDSEGFDEKWGEKVEKLSKLCSSARTHIAFLGTVMIAKATDRRADLFAIKPEHAGKNENAFSARTLSENVLVPLSAELGFNIGVTGRQPLNNMPYFRMTRLDDGTPVRRSSLPAFSYMLELVKELNSMKSEAAARVALRAFIAIRKGYQPRYTRKAGKIHITPEQLIVAVAAFVRQDSEGGKRAQAVAAGLLDVFAGAERVESGRINDPSRHYPGDVCIRESADVDVWEKAFEVRDKPVSISDIQIFGKKCVDMGVREAVILMVADRQQQIDTSKIDTWAAGFGLGLTLFHGWKTFIDQALFWSPQPTPEAAIAAAGFVHERLLAVEASPEGVALWNKLILL
jgi:hypothetical protein